MPERKIKQEIKQYDRQFEPIILGNWNSFKSKDDFFKLFESIKDSDPNFCFLALSYNLLTEINERKISKSISLGINTMPSLSKGDYSGDIAIKMLSQKNVSFVLLDLKDLALFSPEPLIQMNEWLQILLQNNITVFVSLGETQAELINDQAYEILLSQIDVVLKEIPEIYFKKIRFIYSSLNISFKSSDNFVETINHSYNFFRSALENSIGAEKASQIRVMTISPFLSNSCFDLLSSTITDGFFFSNIDADPEGFLQTCK